MINGNRSSPYHTTLWICHVSIWNNLTVIGKKCMWKLNSENTTLVSWFWEIHWFTGARKWFAYRSMSLSYCLILKCMTLLHIIFTLNYFSSMMVDVWGQTFKSTCKSILNNRLDDITRSATLILGLVLLDSTTKFRFSGLSQVDIHALSHIISCITHCSISIVYHHISPPNPVRVCDWSMTA